MLSYSEHELKKSLFDYVDSSIADVLAVLPVLSNIGAELALDLRETARAYISLENSERVPIACDPRIVATVHRINTLIASWDGTSANLSIPMELIAQMRRINLACALKTRRAIIFAEHLSESASFAIPGTTIYLDRVQNGSKIPQLELQDGQVKSPDYLVREMKLPEHDILLALPEFSLQPPWTTEKLLKAETVLHKWVEPVSHAVKLLALDGRSYELVKCFGSQLVAIENEDAGIMSSVSFDSHPGAIFTSWCDRVEMLAETMVHESDHQRHYLFARIHPIWKGGEFDQPAVHRSPWRSDPRPLDGILRGASAFVSVGDFWARILEHCETEGFDDREQWILSRGILTNYQAIDALNVVSGSIGELTDAGQELVLYLSEKARLTKSALIERSDFLRHLKRAEEQQFAHDSTWEDENSAFAMNSNRWSADLYVNY